MESITRLLNDSISQWLPGLGSMPNLHPLFVHFPIALLGAFLFAQLLAFLFNREGSKIAADWLLYLGTLGTVAAAIAGLFASQTVAHENIVHSIMMEHRNMGLNAAALALLLSLLRLFSGRVLTRFGHISHLLLGGWIFFYIIRGADLGGMMVYQHGVGIQTVNATQIRRNLSQRTQQQHGHSHGGGHSHGSGHSHSSGHNHQSNQSHGDISGQIADWFSGFFKKEVTIRPHTH